jgi:hypothetical protein
MEAKGERMTRRIAVLSVLVLAGCSGLRDAVTAHQDVVARVERHELTVDRLAELLAPAKSVPLRREVVDRVAELWVDYQLLARAVAEGDSLLDSATVMAANWPAVAQRLADLMHESVIVRRANLTPTQVDSAYNVGDYRWIHHILVSVRQDTTDAVRAAKRRQAEGYLAQLERGTSFTALAERVTDDQATRESGGSLGLITRGMMVKAFEDAAFALQPGQRSGVVETAFGYHIVWRPPLEQVRDSFGAQVRSVVIDQLDSMYLDSLNTQTGLRVRGSAPAIVRAAAENLRAAKGRSRVLATYHGGRLREKDFARWLQAYAPQTRGQVAQAPDSTLSEFVRNVARNQMLLNAAQRARVRLTHSDRDSIREGYRRDLALMLRSSGVARESLAADTASLSDPRQAAARRVDGYFAAITSNPPRRQFFEVPPFLADVLRSRYDWTISPAGVDRALARATELRGPETPGLGGPGSRMTPVPSARPPAPISPGGPPAGGGQRRP